jgi:hypothetical protein
MALPTEYDKGIATLGSLVIASAGLLLNALLLVIVLSSRPTRAFSNIIIGCQIIFDVLTWYDDLTISIAYRFQTSTDFHGS